MDPIVVYAKVDSLNRITELTSSVFLNDPSGWVRIATCPGNADQKTMDQHVHAQGNYFPDGTFDDYMIPRYKLSSKNKAIPRTAAEMKSDKDALLLSLEAEKQSKEAAENQRIREAVSSAMEQLRIGKT